MKYAVILGDGMADHPIPSLGGGTPLSAARTPNFDAFAKVGEVGLAKTVPNGMKPGSDVANLAVLGYDPQKNYSGRSPLEAVSIGIALGGRDVTLRCNLVTLSDEEKYEDRTMLDYGAGEIPTADAAELIRFLGEKLGTAACEFHAGVSYRHCLVMRGGRTGAELTPPHDISDKKVGAYLPKGENSEFYLGLMKRSAELLKDHPVNLRRVREGKKPATSIWLWGEGTKPALAPFTERSGLRGGVISAVDLIKGIGILAGMKVIDVAGATGTYETNFRGKAQAAVDALLGGLDFVYVHMEAADECGHQGDLEHKIYSVEKIDEVAGAVAKGLRDAGEDFRLLICPDHPTPVALKTHVSDPVPYLLYASDRTFGGAPRYTEAEAAKTGIYVEDGYTLLDRLTAR